MLSSQQLYQGASNRGSTASTSCAAQARSLGRSCSQPLHRQAAANGLQGRSVALAPCSKHRQWNTTRLAASALEAPEQDASFDGEAGDGSSLRRSQTGVLQAPMVQWYPGHIAKAERQLKEQLKMVDVVLEVRDARIPVATHHPQVASWVGPKPRLLVMNRLDMVSSEDKKAWAQYYKDTQQQVYWTDGKAGNGVQGVKAALLAVAEELNVKRARRGLQPRPVRACVIGFPNIGKSALINRLLGRRAVASYAKPGVTRALQWVRLAGELDLLDAPGVIPASFSDQVAAQRLAMCNDIGQAAYVESAIAAALVARCIGLQPASAQKAIEALKKRYSVDPLAGTPEDFVVAVAGKLFFGEIEKAGARILKDYRTCALGTFALEQPGDVDEKRRREVAAAAAKRAAAAEQEEAGRGGKLKDF